MEYLVDGYNLLHAWDRETSGPDTLEAARARLLDALADFAAREGCRITAVFDGVDLPYSDRQTHRGVRVRFSRTPQDADRLIAEMLGRTDHARETTVVSSDRAVQARASGAKVMDSDTFARVLREKPRAPGKRGDTPLSEGEVQDWARTFGISPEEGASGGVSPLKKKRRR